jgi:hypothetical protein
MKKETHKWGDYDVGLYRDGKIALGYFDDINSLMLDKGELINFPC